MMRRDIRLRVEGGMLEKLIDRALGMGARFSRIRRTAPRVMELSTDAAGADILLKLCESYHLNCRILCRGGPAVLRETLLRRRTLAAGMLLCVLLCALCFSRVWLVDICFSGPCAHLGDASAIRAQLAQSGFSPGMPGRNLDTAMLQKQLSAAGGNYSFIGVRRQGVRLLVEAAPEVPVPELYNRGSERDLFAARSGVVESVFVYAGEACVRPGDTVLAGQLLIRGAEVTGKDAQTDTETTRPVGALGEVFARCWCEGGAEAPLSDTTARPTGRERVSCALRLMDYRLPLIKAEPFACEQEEIQIIPLVGLFLPLEMERSTHFELRPQTETRSPAQLAAEIMPLAIADARLKLADGFDEYEIANHWLDTQIEDNTLRVRAVYEICTDIAVTRDVWIEEVY